MEEQTLGADPAPGAAVPLQESHPLNASAPDAHGAARSWMQWIKQGLRAGTLRSVQGLPDGPSAWTMLLLIAAVTMLDVGAQRLEVGGPASFDVRSWLFGWAPAALLIFGVWLVLSWARDKATHASPVAAWYLLFSIATLPMGLLWIATRAYGQRQWPHGGWIAWTIFAAFSIWLVITTWRVSQAVTHSRRVAVSLLLYVLFAQFVAISQIGTRMWQPVESYDEDDYATFDLTQEVFESQQALLQKSLAAITPSTGSVRQTYGLVYAPYDQDVFLRESAMVQKLLEERYGAHGRVVRLVNNSASAADLPWATTLNLERTLRALAEAMDTERDVLVMYLTSHGGSDFKLSAQNWPLAVEDLTAAKLRSMLDELGIRHRVIAVSACYSGGWIEPLRSEDTLVMTAADKEHTSYGCGSKSELTFFGRAVFDEQLRKTLSFEDAFKAAVPVIKQREIEAKKDDGFSNPQIFVGGNIRATLGELTAGR